MSKRATLLPPYISPSNGQATHTRGDQPGSLRAIRPPGWDTLSGAYLTAHGWRCAMTGMLHGELYYKRMWPGQKLTQREQDMEQLPMWDMQLQGVIIPGAPTVVATYKESELDYHEVSAGNVPIRGGLTYRRVVTCHVNHDPLDCRPENLRPWAEYHGQWDHWQHLGQRLCTYAAQGRLTVKACDEALRRIRNRQENPVPTEIEWQYGDPLACRDLQPLTPGELEFLTMLCLAEVQYSAPERLLRLVSKRLGYQLHMHSAGGIMRALKHLALRGLARCGEGDIWEAMRETVVLEPGVTERPEKPSIIPPGWKHRESIDE